MNGMCARHAGWRHSRHFFCCFFVILWRWPLDTREIPWDWEYIDGAVEEKRVELRRLHERRGRGTGAHHVVVSILGSSTLCNINIHLLSASWRFDLAFFVWKLVCVDYSEEVSWVQTEVLVILLFDGPICRAGLEIPWNTPCSFGALIKNIRTPCDRYTSCYRIGGDITLCTLAALYLNSETGIVW